MRKPMPPITPETNLEPLFETVRNVNRVIRVVSPTKNAKASHPIKPICVKPVKSEIKRMAPQIRVIKNNWE